MVWCSGRFSEGERCLGWRLALRLVLPGLRCAGTLKPARRDDNIPNAGDFRDGLQVVDSLLAPVRSWADQLSGEL